MSQKIIFVILGIVVIVLIGITVYFAMTKNVSQPAATTSNIAQQSVSTPTPQPPAPTPVAQQTATPQPTPAKINKIDTSDWQLFNAEKEGIAASILPNFKFPQNWHTIDISGGRMVEVIFSDSSQKNIADETNNECRFSVLFNGDNGSQKISKNNSKNTSALKDECNLILTELEKQAAK